MKLGFLIVLMGLCSGLLQARDKHEIRLRVSLTDKAVTTFSLDNPAEFLSQKALERRKRQHISVDSTDLPVCDAYIKAIEKLGGKILVKGKWENFVTISTHQSSMISKLQALPFVRLVEKVWDEADVKDDAAKPAKRDSLVNNPIRTDSLYGPAMTQLKINNGHKLHEAGFKGQGMTIAVIDAGFHNADSITAMQNIKIAGTRDFVSPAANMFEEDDHGLAVLSCLAMNDPYVMIGTAPEATYWLLRSEDSYSESWIEQDYWSAAIEFADSVGVDVVNTSLGYYIFDDPSKNYEYIHLDGKFALMSRQASRIADKGMVLMCSAGNTGRGTWKKITPPADAENILTVGAVDKKKVLAPFSGVGNTTDNRIKPDVMAVGQLTNVMGTNGNLRRANGTSFSTPILCGMVTCLWQALPHLTAKEIIELVRKSGDRADHPDNIYGYGIPDMWKAYNLGK